MLKQDLILWILNSKHNYLKGKKVTGLMKNKLDGKNNDRVCCFRIENI